jgi:hypothetical protein
MYNNPDDLMDLESDDTSYQNKIILQSSNKNFRMVNRKIGKRKKIKLCYFTTSFVPNSKMVNAITGFTYRDEDPKIKYLVGSIQEDLLFKVCISNGENKQGPVILYYDSPEQFEKHQYITIDQSIKEKWLNKKMQYIYSKRLEIKNNNDY